MESIQIKNLDDKLLTALRQLAESHHRSLESELHFILKSAVSDNQPEDDGEFNLITVNTGRQSSFTREEVYDDDGR